MLVLAFILGTSAYAAGEAKGGTCKEAVQAGTPWAIPPLNAPGKVGQAIQWCRIDFTTGVQVCMYSNAEGTACTGLVDVPKNPKWLELSIDCKSGEPVDEQRL